MIQRGRNSTTGLTTVAPEFTRPAAPEGLSEEETTEWNAIVGRMPADWFTRETHELLIRYLKHRTTARKLTEKIDLVGEPTEENIIYLNRLVTLRNRESGQLVNLARAMRLTQHSRLKAETAYVKSSKSKENKPWIGANAT